MCAPDSSLAGGSCDDVLDCNKERFVGPILGVLSALLARLAYTALKTFTWNNHKVLSFVVHTAKKSRRTLIASLVGCT